VLADITSYAPPYALRSDHGELRHRRFAVRVEQLRAVIDDAAVLLRRARQEARHVLERDNGMLNASQKRMKRAPLRDASMSRHAGELVRLVRDDADARPAEPREADDDVAREPLVDLEELAVVDDARLDPCMSYGLFDSVGTIESSAASARVGSSVHDRRRRVLERC
jgi:hypothetical protein